MPFTPTYPGVYIEEIPSGVRTITGVPTSIAAFMGRTPSGSVNEPTTIHSFGDFERLFGGLAVNYPVSYAVRDFYLNGGSQAIVVRLFNKAGLAGEGVSAFAVDSLLIVASSPGEWANKLRVRVAYDDLTKREQARDRLGLQSTDIFKLSVVEIAPDGAGDGKLIEEHSGLTIEDSPRRVDRVLRAQSSLIRVALDNSGDPQIPDAAPADNSFGNGTGGEDSAGLTAVTHLTGTEPEKTGMYALLKADLFNILCVPPDTRGGDLPDGVFQAAAKFCADRRAMLIVDPPATPPGATPAAASEAVMAFASSLSAGMSTGARGNSALYFPRVLQADPLQDGRPDTLLAPCGAVAGVMARTDEQRGVWKAPAGLNADLRGIKGLGVPLNDAENGVLNPRAINCLRSFPNKGHVVWGARTLAGDDRLASEWKYVPVRRTALYIEESLYRGTQWAVFEPNGEPLWAQIRLDVGAFMHNLFRRGAFQGRAPGEAYFVKCDGESTTRDDISRGVFNIVVGFAPLKPVEFVVIRIQQRAEQVDE